MRRFAVLTFATVCAATVYAGTIEPVVIVHETSDVNELTRSDLSRIYLGRTTTWENGRHIRPAIPDLDSATARTFMLEVMNRTKQQVLALWKRRMYSGAGSMPRVFRTSQAVLDYVAVTPGAIGVLAQPPGDPRVQVVAVTGG